LPSGSVDIAAIPLFPREGAQEMFRLVRAHARTGADNVYERVVTGRIVNNESVEIMEMLNSEFNAFSDVQLDLYPADRRAEVDALSEWIVADVCRGVYRVGFARSQADYDREIDVLFNGLARLEQRLQQTGPFLLGEQITAPDIHLFTMLCRFETYHDVLRCDLREIDEFPALLRFRGDVGRYRDIGTSVKLDHIRIHYSHDLGEIDASIVSAGAGR
jgi:putative glutathione S-transferase